MKAAAARFPEKTIAIFCHSAVLRGVLMELFFHRDPAQVPYCDNTAVSKLLWDGRAFTYEFLNDNSHLPEALQGSRQSSRRCCNLWYRSIDRQVPPGWPQPPEHAVSFLAIAQEEPVGLLSLDRQAGRICRLFLPDKFRGQYGEDQLLGQAVSCLRRWGHKTVTIRRQDAEPDELLDRYGFRPAGALLSCNLDPSVYSFGIPAPGPAAREHARAVSRRRGCGCSPALTRPLGAAFLPAGALCPAFPWLFSRWRRRWEPVASLPWVPLVALSVAPPAPSVWAVVFWVCPVGLLVPVGTVAVPVPLVPFTTPSVLLDTLPPSQPVRSMAVIASTIARIDPFFTKFLLPVLARVVSANFETFIRKTAGEFAAFMVNLRIDSRCKILYDKQKENLSFFSIF